MKSCSLMEDEMAKKNLNSVIALPDANSICDWKVEDTVLEILEGQDVEASATDAGFHYEYGSIRGYHPDTDYEVTGDTHGTIEIKVKLTGIPLSEDELDPAGWDPIVHDIHQGLSLTARLTKVEQVEHEDESATVTLHFEWSDELDTAAYDSYRADCAAEAYADRYYSDDY